MSPAKRVALGEWSSLAGSGNDEAPDEIAGVDFIAADEEKTAVPDTTAAPDSLSTAQTPPPIPEDPTPAAPELEKAVALEEPTCRRTTREQTGSRFVLAEEAPAIRPKAWLTALICIVAIVALAGATWGILHSVEKQKVAEIVLAVPEGNEYWRVNLEERDDDGTYFEGYSIYLTCTNVSDVPFTPEYATARWYDGDEVKCRLAADYEFMRRWMDSAALIQGESPLVLLFQSNYQRYTKAVFTLDGADANGHAQQYTFSLNLMP